MSAPHNPGRVAGFWYLLLVLVGPLRLIYIPSKLFDPRSLIVSRPPLPELNSSSNPVCAV